MANTHIISKKLGLKTEIGPAEEHAIVLSAIKTENTTLIPFSKASILEYLHNSNILSILSEPAGKIDVTSLANTYNKEIAKQLEKLFQDYYLHSVPLMNADNKPISPSEYVCTILQMMTAFADMIDHNNGNFFKKNKSKKQGFAKTYPRR